MKQRLLWDELQRYGYEFRWKKGIALFCSVVAGALGLGIFFHLDCIYLVILASFCLLLLPFFLRNLYANRYEQQRFMEANTYIEQFLYSFRKSGRILASLHDVDKLFTEGKMHETIREAIRLIEETYDTEDTERYALQGIAEEYPMQQMEMMHRFALQVERDGGAYDGAIRLMLDARRMEADRVYTLLREKRHKRTQIIISVVVSLLLCAMFVYVAHSVSLEIADYTLTKVTTLFVLLLDVWILYIADKRLALQCMEEDADDKEELRAYERLRATDGRNHRMGQRVAIRRVTRGLQKVFPQWLLEVSLLLQSENVHVALLQSYEEAPALLQPELKQLLSDLDENPEAMEPYLSFFADIPLPEIRSSMRMLYALSDGSGGNATHQISDIISRNQQLMDQSQRIRNEDALAGLYALFLAPQLTGGAKMLADMVMMFYAMSLSGFSLPG